MEVKRPPIRRRFRFSLRTMLVLVMLVCAYLGWAMNWKRQREAFLKAESVLSHEPLECPAPIWIRITGAEGRSLVALRRPPKVLVIKEAKRLFPEADRIIYEEGNTMWTFKAD